MKEKIVALFAKPTYHIENDWHVWEGFSFDTQIQDYVQNFMHQTFHNDYFLVYESDFRKSKKHPFHLQYKNKASNGKWVDVMTTDVHVVPHRGGCSFELIY